MDNNRNVLQATTDMEENSYGILSVVSRLPKVKVRETYILQIENALVASVSRAQLAGTERDERRRRMDNKVSRFKLIFSRPECFSVFIFQLQPGPAHAGVHAPQHHGRRDLHVLSDVTTHKR